MDFLSPLCGHLKELVHAVPPRTTEDLVTKLQAAVTTVDANMRGRVRENAMRRPVSASRWTESSSNIVVVFLKFLGAGRQ
jgi:hypothetical protein